MAERWHYRMIRLPDWLIPSVEGPPPTPPDAIPLDWGTNPDVALVRLAHAELRSLIGNESDRMKAVDTKLVAVGAVAPLAMSIVTAVVTFLTSGRVANYTAPSVVAVVVGAVYVGVNFLAALRSSVRGLQARGYAEVVPSSLVPPADSCETAYLLSLCDDLSARTEQHRNTTNEKLSHLNVAHRALVNAFVGLFCTVVLLATIAIIEKVR